MPFLLQSAEMCWRGKLRENSIRNLPNRFLHGNGTPHFRLNDPIENSSQPRVTSSHRFPQLSSFPNSQFQDLHIPVVGIVGGVGAGKSTVVQNVADVELFIIDADRIGHDLLLTDQIRSQLHSAFGKEVFSEARQVDRRRLAEKVFGNSDEHIKNLNRLNEIIHPTIRMEIQRLVKQAPQDVDAIILDAALLLETGWADECDAVIFIDTPLKQRQLRVAKNRGWSVEELERRESSQWSLQKKREAAQFVVDNSGSPESAAEQMKLVLEEICEQYGASRR